VCEGNEESFEMFRSGKFGSRKLEIEGNETMEIFEGGY